jgi:enoyl-CoA hydratase
MTSKQHGPPVTIESAERVAIVRLDDGKANVLSLPTMSALQVALADAATDASAIVLAGRAGCFSAGLDREAVTGDASKETISATLRAATALYRAVAEAPVPLVVACTGHALAGGALLLLCGDVRLGSTGDVRIGLTETQVGLALPPLAMALARARIMPSHLVRATIAGEAFDPSEAVKAGFLDRVYEPGALVDHAVEEATRLGKIRTAAYQGTRTRLWAPIWAEVELDRARARAARASS